jgi:hypothetical protein
LALEDLIDVGYASEMSLRLWSRIAQLALGTKYVTVEARNPLASARGHIEIIDSGLDVRRDSVPIKLRIFIDDICWRFVAKLPVQTNFFKFVVERIGFSQIVGIAKLTDEIGIAPTTVELGKEALPTLSR